MSDRITNDTKARLAIAKIGKAQRVRRRARALTDEDGIDGPFDRAMDRQLRLYVVATERFGGVTIQAYDIAEARRDARLRFGVKNPRAVTPQRRYQRCANCDSQPCCCGGRQ